MFDPSTLAFICIFLFMVHEFEEIVCIRPYIQRNRKDKRFTNEIFVTGGNKVYPSTESIALMICEEFILACIILFIGIIANSAEITLAPFIVFTLHLIPHALEASRFPGWAPGSRTAVLMLLPSIVIIVAAIMTQPIQPILLVLWTMVIGAILVFNLRLLHSIAGRFDQKSR